MNQRIFNRFCSTFKATEKVIKEMAQFEGISSDEISHFSYLVNKEAKTALLLKCVTKQSKKAFQQKRSRQSYNRHDAMRLSTTVSEGKKGINFFLNKPEYAGYTIALSTANYKHECCVFFRKENNQINRIFFNPNYSKTVHGVQRNNIAAALLSSWGKRPAETRAYNADCGNTDGKCVTLVWNEIFKMLCIGISPFDNTKLQLHDFSRCLTDTTRLRYKNGEKIRPLDRNLCNFSLWYKLDNILRNVPDIVRLEAFKIIWTIICDFLSKS